MHILSYIYRISANWCKGYKLKNDNEEKISMESIMTFDCLQRRNKVIWTKERRLNQRQDPEEAHLL